MAAIAPKRTNKPKLVPANRRTGKRVPSHNKLKELAKTSPPPQSWYEQTDNPFEKPR